MNQLTKIALAWDLFCQGVPKNHIAKLVSAHRETIGLWISGVVKHPDNLSGYLENYLNCKKGERSKRKVDPILKDRVWTLRDNNNDCCGQKIQKYLTDQYGSDVSVPTIYKILSEKYKLRSKWKKNKARGPVPEANAPREVIQMDTVDFGELFAFTAVDIFSKDVSVKLYPSLTSTDGLDFLTHSFETRYKHTDLLQTDGGPEFKAEFKNNVLKFADRHRISAPYRKNEQSYIESFNRSLRKECLGWIKYKHSDLQMLNSELTSYLDYYHNKRAHLGINLLTPNQILEIYKVSDI